ncbi:TRAP transporter 4TM/12TM fusion protein [Streptosporangium becharense]|uniref:TRAP transporter 4TM/12TM fusion protein n=1 Tax=Streptosporangium becharense TaxID=1816182 RepID=A0A7W9IL44_9ACTN|nr:TRAP transporter fused permease subunit [Streptosporangium becharense]MBB2911429.1 TRAP transporter 4TM/12TM fusion protein [Streptosporangium becharense]MBB5822753.1 TRAP transporter 4TM/12TM fusion protein [Streptosporangium becharense]
MTGTTAADELIAEFDAERPARRLDGRVAGAVTLVALGLSLYVLYHAFRPGSVLPYRMLFLAVVLPLTFVCYKPRRRGTDRPGAADWALAALSFAACLYPLVVFDDFIRRAFAPTALDMAAGAVIVLLILEACRRTVGWILPAVCLAFAAYAYYGGHLPFDWAVGHRGYDADRIIASFVMGTDGVYGVPLDVAATYIILFTVYGAVLDHSGAGRFFVDVSLAAFRRSRSAPGRTVTMAGFLLGTVSGSGVATTVSVGSVAWPILRRAGYPPEQGGGVLAAAGIGAILSPPTLGAAAFIIAEYMRVSYLTVLLYATIPTVLYYLGVFLAIEIDARKYGTRPVEVDAPRFRPLVGRFGYHFSSLFVIIALMALGQSPFRAVVYATLLAVALSFLDREHALTPRRAARALAAGATGVLPVAATCAAAGLIVAVVTLTGLGLKASSLIVGVSGGILAVTALLCAAAVLVLGLAVPVTASFVIAAVIIGPALANLGVSQAEAYLFIFYYAVLSEVSPPTALSAFAASAITGGNAYRTMMATWKYTLPAFLVPFAFVLTPGGSALLAQGTPAEILTATAVSSLAVAALAAATGGWLLGPAGAAERALCGVAAVLLLFLSPLPVLAGAGVLILAVFLHLLVRRREALS